MPTSFRAARIKTKTRNRAGECRRSPSRHTPRKRGIQYAAALRFRRWRLWNTGSPAFAGDPVVAWPALILPEPVATLPKNITTRANRAVTSGGSAMLNRRRFVGLAAAAVAAPSIVVSRASAAGWPAKPEIGRAHV